MHSESAGVVWAIDGLVGHLAIAQRSGYLDELYHRPTLCFVTADDAIASIPSAGSPSAVLLGYVSTADVNKLLREPALESTPKLFAHHPANFLHVNEMPDWEQAPNVYVATDDMTTYTALEKFASDVVNAQLPSWPSKGSQRKP